MKIHHDLISVLMFWSLYVPMSLVLWFETGHKEMGWQVKLQQKRSNYFLTLVKELYWGMP